MLGLYALSLLPLLASAAPTFSTETIHEGAAPLLSSSNAEAVPDSYIVVFKKHVTDAKASEHHSWVQDIHLQSENARTELRKRSQFPMTNDIFEGIKHTYSIAGDFLGYSGHFDDSVIEKVRRHPDVSSPESSFLDFPAINASLSPDSTLMADHPRVPLASICPSRCSSTGPVIVASQLTEASHVTRLICPCFNWHG
jgi:hypothetical protein